MGPIWNKAKIIIKCPVYFRGICKIRRAPRSCKGLYNLQKILNNPRGGCGDFEGDATWKNEEKEEYRCETCHRRISQEEAVPSALWERVRMRRAKAFAFLLEFPDPLPLWERVG